MAHRREATALSCSAPSPTILTLRASIPLRVPSLGLSLPPHYQGTVDYRKGRCPVTEEIEERRMIATEFVRPPATLDDMGDVVRAFEKVYEHRRALASNSAGERRG